MTLLILGLLLWSAAHLFKRLAPDARAGIGDAGKGLVAAGVLAGVVLMVMGYRAAPVTDLWSPPAFLRHVNNLLMLIAVYLFAASGLKTAVTRAVRHPQLTAVKTWAVAHLLVNGDLASVVLFGGLLLWAVAEVVLINRAVPRAAPNPPAGAAREVAAAVAAVVGLVAIGQMHAWLGAWPWG